MTSARFLHLAMQCCGGGQVKCLFQCLMGMECSTFTILAAEQKHVKGVTVMENDADKLCELNNQIILGLNGDPGDMNQLMNYIEKSLTLYRFRNGYDLETEAMVHFTRKMLYDSFATLNPYFINSLVGGYSKEKGGQLYFMDYFATCVPVAYAAHGWAGMFTQSILQKGYRRDLTQEEAYDILKQCVREIQQRFFLNTGSFQVKVVDEHGISQLPVITETSFF